MKLTLETELLTFAWFAREMNFIPYVSKALLI